VPGAKQQSFVKLPRRESKGPCEHLSTPSCLICQVFSLGQEAATCFTLTSSHGSGAGVGAGAGIAGAGVGAGAGPDDAMAQKSGMWLCMSAHTSSTWPCVKLHMHLSSE